MPGTGEKVVMLPAAATLVVHTRFKLTAARLALLS